MQVWTGHLSQQEHDGMRAWPEYNWFAFDPDRFEAIVDQTSLIRYEIECEEVVEIPRRSRSKSVIATSAHRRCCISIDLTLERAISG